MNQDFLSKYFPDQIDRVKGRLFDPWTNRKMAWVHFTERQRSTFIQAMLSQHNASVPDHLQIHLAGTNDDEHIITSTGRRHLQSHAYYKQIVDCKDEDDTYWEACMGGEGDEDDTPRELKKLQLQNVVNTDPISLNSVPTSLKRPCKQVESFVPVKWHKGETITPHLSRPGSSHNDGELIPVDTDSPHVFERRIVHTVAFQSWPAQPDDVWHFPIPRAQLEPEPPILAQSIAEAQPTPPAETVEPRSNGVEELVDLFNTMKENF